MPFLWDFLLGTTVGLGLFETEFPMADADLRLCPRLLGLLLPFKDLSNVLEKSELHNTRLKILGLIGIIPLRIMGLLIS
jgi:hypothetical protein